MTNERGSGYTDDVVDEIDDESRYFDQLQSMVDDGTAWLLEGSVGRAAMDAIESGRIMLGPVSHRDYWGNRVPSRYEVEEGTVGSEEYYREHNDA